MSPHGKWGGLASLCMQCCQKKQQEVAIRSLKSWLNSLVCVLTSNVTQPHLSSIRCAVGSLKSR